MSPRLEGHGVVLRALEVADAQALFAAHGDAATLCAQAGAATLEDAFVRLAQLAEAT